MENRLINNLTKANNTALVTLLMMVLPIGIMCFIAIAAAVEFFGITMFFSNLFITKTNEYILKVTANFQDFKGFAHGIAFFLSLGAGFLLAIIVVFSAFILKLIEKNSWSYVCTVASFLMVFTTYYGMFGEGISFKVSNLMLLFGVLVATFFSSGIVAILSGHLSKLIKALPEFEQMRGQIVSKLSTITQSTSNRFLNFNK